MMIDIRKGFRQFSPQELRDYAYSGHLTCGNTDLSDFLEYIFTDYKLQSEIEIDQDELDAIKEEEYDRGRSDAKAEAIAAVENI